jgi:hypothetical protein
MRARLCRFVAVSALVAGAAVWLLVGVADAKGKPVRTSLTCASITGTATLTVQMLTATLGGQPVGPPVQLTCGPDSASGLTTDTAVLKGLPSSPAAYSWSASYTTSNGAGGCFGTAGRGAVQTCADNTLATAITFNAA